MMDSDDRLDEDLSRALRELDPPPTTPREEMWAGIVARRAAAANSTGRAPAVVELRPGRHNPWLRWGAPLAAMLVVGIGLGRVSVRQPGPATPPLAEADPGAVTPAGADVVPPAYRFAATQHLQRTETLFASLVVDARTRGAAELSSGARELLTDTRLLLGSPAAADPAMARLLQDLELVLSQIAAIPQARAREELELIQDGINQSDVLLRLRAATAGPTLVGT